MSSLKPHFSVPEYEGAISHLNGIIRGEKYRITILSDVLVRLEYSETGAFEDRPTELVKFRAFDVLNLLKRRQYSFSSFD